MTCRPPDWEVAAAMLKDAVARGLALEIIEPSYAANTTGHRLWRFVARKVHAA